ncbi:peptidase S26B, signal peptidase [Pyrolobus fumarii 1A]|uniref:Peptidase S26B, signal peptidase n=1 Tax=Pyrolobus fumarii (strain DSM 11204 / 1A) TaxID=694429 RepID=G0EDJ4_PYRF1|nr:peptidase S26B, signal peptidase [Pyrolobus fumarii 1A]
MSILIAAVAALIIKTAWSSMGLTLVVVEGASMEPLFHSGDLVLVQHVPPQDIHVGDIIVYQGCGGKLIIHRVYLICNNGGTYCYVTWGDNNPAPDTPNMICSTCLCTLDGIYQAAVPYEKVVGKVVEAGGFIYKVPYIGALASLLRS